MPGWPQVALLDKSGLSPGWLQSFDKLTVSGEGGVYVIS